MFEEAGKNIQEGSQMCSAIVIRHLKRVVILRSMTGPTLERGIFFVANLTRKLIRALSWIGMKGPTLKRSHLHAPNEKIHLKHKKPHG